MILDLDAYDTEIRDRVRAHEKSEVIYEALVISEARLAADRDGCARFTLPPELAHDTQHLVEAAAQLKEAIGRANIAFEVPATTEGIDALEICLIEGLNVTATSIFSISAYRQVIEAYFGALEHRIAREQDVSLISAGARFVAAAIEGEEQPMLAASAAVRLAQDVHRELFSSPQWQALSANGAQRMPMFIERIGEGELVQIDRARAHEVLDDLSRRGISMDERSAVWLEEAIERAQAEVARTIEAIEAKRRAMPEGSRAPDARNIANLGVWPAGLPDT